MADIGFLYFRRSLRAVRRHWATHHDLLGLTQIGRVPKSHGWSAFRFAGQPVFFASFQTRWPEIILVHFGVEDRYAFLPDFLQAVARFLKHREMWPSEAFLITQSMYAAGLWFTLDSDAPQEVFQTIRGNCDEHVQQLRIIGPRFSDRFEELTATAAPYASKSWIDGRYLWIDFDWPCRL